MRMSKIVYLSMVFGCMFGSALAEAASSVKLNWSIPSTRENGKALAASELAGYELYYTTDNPAVSGSIKVSGGTTSTYTVKNLAAGNYHFAMAAIDANGLKSKLSAIATVKVAAAVSTAAPLVPTIAKVSITSSANKSASKGVNVSWIPPKARTDGTPLAVADLSGYKITLRDFFLGSTLNAAVNGGGVTNHVLSNIKSGFYVAELKAIDKTGKQSASTYYYVNVL